MTHNPRKLLFVPFQACLNDKFEPAGDRFNKAKAAIAKAIGLGWRVTLVYCAEWGQQAPYPYPETYRYTLKVNRWGIGGPQPEKFVRDLADRMAALQPAGNPTMRGLFCPNKRADLPTECYQIKFTHRPALSIVHHSFRPQWAALAQDGPGNHAYKLPSAGMLKLALLFEENWDHRAAAVWHVEIDRVANNAAGLPLFSSDEWLAGIDPYEKSKWIEAIR